MIYRHVEEDLHHAALEVYYWKRPKRTEPYVLQQIARLDGEKVDLLLKYLVSIPHYQSLSVREAAGTLIVRANNGDISAEETKVIAEKISELVSSDIGLQTIREGLLTTDTFSNIRAAAQQASYKSALAELKTMMDDSSLPEPKYQTWFENHAWVFGTEYVRRIPTRTIGLHSDADILLVSVDGFVDLFELKLPNASVLLHDSSHESYYPSASLAKVIGQVVNYLKIMADQRHELQDDWNEQLMRPRAFIIIGRSCDWTAEMHQSFRNLRSSLHNIEVLTYDHVVARIEQLIRQYEE